MTIDMENLPAPIHCCQKCGENIGYIGRFLFLGLFHKCVVKKNENDLLKAKRYAILALAYWKNCKEESDIQIQIEGTSTYVRLGK